MKDLRHISFALLLAVLISCGATADKNTKDLIADQDSIVDKVIADITDDIDLITNVYDTFVFAVDSQGDLTPESYFTDNALKKLQNDYEFDCDEGPCYAFYALRTGMQDSKPGTDGASQIHDIEPDGDWWYVVTYSDMGWHGETRVSVIDGKIDDYKGMLR